MPLRAAAWTLAGLLALAAGAARAEPVLMPQPKAVAYSAGALPLAAPFAARASGCPQPLISHALSRFAADIARQRSLAEPQGAGPTLTVRCRSADAGYLSLEAKAGYRLDVDAQGVRIDADGPAGALHALATLRQLVGVGTEPANAPFVRIEDAPRFAWRGVMVDTARHFMSLTALKRQVDAMERVKLDVLHLHLSDNEGFRVESLRYPKLQATQHGEFYTQAEIRELVAYAAERGVRIVPEFDVPAHTGAICAAYPEIAAAGDPADAFAVFDRALNPASEATYRFLDGLLGEMAGLFPDADFHVGGDEVSDAAWSHEPAVAAFMAAHGLKSRVEMEAYFHSRVREMLARRGKTAVGWDEIAATPIPKTVIVQAWRNANATGLAVAGGHPTIVSAGYYLDQLMPAASHYAVDPVDLQGDGLTSAEVARLQTLSPLAGGAARPLEIKPMPPLTPEQETLVLGGEMALWSELVTDEMLDARLWPRAAALAERFWSPRDVRDPDSLARRLPVIEDELNLLGLQADASRARMATRLAPDAPDAVATFLETVAPSRYATHNQTLRAMLAGQRHPPPQRLTAPADAAPVDGAAALRFELAARRLAAGDRAALPVLRAQLRIWAANAPRFAEAARGHPDLEAALPVNADVAALSAAGLDALDAIEHGQALGPGARQQAAPLLARALAEHEATSRPVFAFLAKRPPADLIVAIAPAVEILVKAAQTGA
ncbi:family 20 glycosylhydrolase [Phenylobacterium sp.]|uniref:beta-N-acetylhexosaminidase n=1 Tax=Phenylobacterium sp. TaxID=1871053 RepID=UPI0025D4DA10|nr:family 20 glycosylhydrolase [Phenylobacterium sp.]